jgi:hypothetical protein
MTRKTKTRLLAGLGIVAGVLVLAGCSKPAPNITAQSGRTSIVVKPSTYCFNPNDCMRQGVNVPSITVAPGETILVDVPRKVVANGWAVEAVDPVAKSSLGNSGAITDSHSYRLTAGVNNGSPYIVQVMQLNGAKPDGSVWSFIVKVDPTKT